MLCDKFGLDPLADGVVISHKEGHTRGIASNHGDPEHLWSQLGMGYTMDTFRKAVKAKMGGSIKTSGTQASEFANLTEAQAVAKIGPLCREDMKRSGILASVSAAQFILESGYGKSELAQNANNCFGMKKSLSGNSWSGSSWDGTSIYTKKTQEQHPDGTYETITADFRKYPCVEDTGTDYYPAIIDKELFDKAQERRKNNARSQNRIRPYEIKEPEPEPVNFHLKKVSTKFDDPYKQAEYAYGLIEEEFDE